MWFLVPRSPGCIAPDAHLPLRKMKGGEEGGGTFAMPSPAGSLRMGHPQRQKDSERSTWELLIYN